MTLRQKIDLEELDFQRLDKVHSRDMLSFNVRCLPHDVHQTRPTTHVQALLTRSPQLLAAQGNAFMNENSASLDTTFLGPSSEAEESEEAAAAAAAFDVVLESAVRGLEDRVTPNSASAKTAGAVSTEEMPPTQSEPTPTTAEALFGYQSRAQATCSSGVVAPSHAEPRVDAGSSPSMSDNYGGSTGAGSSHAHPRVSSASSMPQQAASAMATQSAVSSAMRAAFHPGGIGAATAQTAFGGAGGLSLGPAGATMLPAFFPPGVFPGLDMIGTQRLASDPAMFQNVMQTFATPGVPGGMMSRGLTNTEQMMANRQLQHGVVQAQQAAKPPQGPPFLAPSAATAAATHATDGGATSSRSPRVQGAHTAAAAAAAAASQLMHAEAEACSLARGGACKPGAINRKPWSRQEDNAIRALVSKLGQRWRVIAPHLAGRSDDSVRNRWKRISEEGDENGVVAATSDSGLPHLDYPRGPIKPPTKQSTASSSSASAGTGESGRASWSRTEDQVIVRAVQELGPRWSAVAARLPSRTEQAVRNRWNRLQQRARVGARQAALSAQRQAAYM